MMTTPRRINVEPPRYDDTRIRPWNKHNVRQRKEGKFGGPQGRRWMFFFGGAAVEKWLEKMDVSIYL